MAEVVSSSAMAEAAETTSMNAGEVLAAGRRHLAVKDYTAAVTSLGRACELLAEEHGEQADHCAEAYLWYGKALLGLSREESGVLGDRIAQGDGEAGGEDDDDDDSDDDNEGEDDKVEENGKAESSKVTGNGVEVEKADAKPAEGEQPSASASKVQPDPPNGEGNGDESVADLGDEDDVENLQLAWEMLDLSRAILTRRVAANGGDVARALLADVHLTLGEVALESETYDKAVIDMQNCLEIQKELYKNDDRRIAETHYQIGLANSLSSNFEDAITHFKNAANILETRINTLEKPSAATEDATVKKYAANDPFYSVAGEIKELKELLPEIHEKIQDMLDYKAETIKRVREQLCPSNGQGSSQQSNSAGSAGSSGAPVRQASDISHLIKRKRKSSEGEDGGTATKKAHS